MLVHLEIKLIGVFDVRNMNIGSNNSNKVLSRV